MNALNKFYNAILVVLAIFSLVLCILWQMEHNKVSVLKLEKAELNTTLVSERAANKIALANAATARAKAIHELELKLAKREAELKGEINELQIRYDSNVAITNGLREQISDFNRRISSLTRERLETYAITGSNSLGECISETVELENLARRYYTEREYFRNLKVDVPPTIIAVDENGASVDLGEVVKVKAELKDFKTVVDTP